MMKWTVLNIYGWYDGPLSFTARGQDGDVLFFRWIGGFDGKRMFSADIPHGKRDTHYVYENDDDVDWTIASRT
jgi:hypothetical protein